MSRSLALTGKYRSLHPAYPVSYITGIEYENRAWKLSGGKSHLLWRVFTFKGRGREEFVWSQDALTDVYLRRGLVGTAGGIRFLPPSRALSFSSVDLDEFQSLDLTGPKIQRRQKLTQILKFTTTAHIDMSYKVFPDTAIVTRVLPLSPTSKKMRYAYFYNGLFHEKHCTLAEFKAWKTSNVTVFFV